VFVLARRALILHPAEKKVPFYLTVMLQVVSKINNKIHITLEKSWIAKKILVERMITKI
jgi:hypothetical protein